MTAFGSESDSFSACSDVLTRLSTSVSSAEGESDSFDSLCNRSFGVTGGLSTLLSKVRGLLARE